MKLNQQTSNRQLVKAMPGALRRSFILSRRNIRSAVLICGVVAITLLSGCTVGPKLYESSFTQYNDTVRRTLDEQLLSNLVRMRYLESPIFLQVSSVNASFSVGANAGIGGTFPSGSSNTGTADLGGSYSENPTISFSMPESRKYYGRLLAPISADQITSLVMAGFDSELVFRTAARSMNRLKNTGAELTGDRVNTSTYPEFLEAVQLMSELPHEGVLDLEFGARAALWSSPVEVNVTQDRAKVFLLREVMNAMQNDAEIIANSDGQWQAMRFERHMALRFAPDSSDSADARRLRELLGLNTESNNFPIVEPELVNAEKPKGALGITPGVLDPDNVWGEVGLRGRSMMEIMQVAAMQVDGPANDIERGTVTANSPQGSENPDWLHIRSSESKPDNSSLAIQYRGHWFYIDDSDLQSREAFSLLTALFAVIGGTVPGAHPVLTLPVN